MNLLDSIRVCRPHIQSRAAYMLLVNRLRNKDKTTQWKENPYFRKNFLAAFFKRYGQIYCEYCGKHPLLVDGRELEKNKGNILKEWLATLDHIVPLSRGGAEFDPANIKVSCPRCNRDKDNKSVKEFLLERT